MRNRLKRQDIFIFILSIVLLLFLNVIEQDRRLVKDSWYEEKYEAARLMKQCLEEIRAEKLKRGIEIDLEYDKNNTGIIGVEFNGITTTLGSLESKRTSANPNFAAVIVHLMKEAGLKAGDKIAVNFSSSFPALNIAVLSAAEVLKLEPVIIASIGSSTWGGNNLEFTYLDMEEHLFNKGLISHKSVAFSIGGAKDIGKDMDENEVRPIVERLKNRGKEFILEEDLKKNIELRYEIYSRDGKEIRCFINVGGNIVSFGGSGDAVDTPPGLIRNRKFKLTDNSGLVQLFNSKGIPVIHILNVLELANRYGLKIDPSSPVKIGEGKVYYTYRYPKNLIILVVVLTLMSLIILKKRTRSTYD